MRTKVRIPSVEFNESTHVHQRRFFSAFDAGCRRFWLRWHRRARKTTAATNLLIREAVRSRNRVYVYMGPTYKQAKMIAWSDPNMLFKWLPDPDAVPWEKNEQELTIRFPTQNTTLRIIGGDDPDSARGIDPHGVVFDEWALMKPEVWTEIVRPIMAQDEDRWAAFIFTPKGQNHAYDMDMAADGDQWSDGGQWYYDVLKASESGLIGQKELDRAREDMPPGMYQQEFEVSFVAEEDRVLITSAMLDNLKGVNRHVPEAGLTIACDPSLGGDRCVIKVFLGTKEIEQEVAYDRDTMKIVGRLLMQSTKHGCDRFVIDCIGIGAGVCDRLSEMGKTVIRFHSAESSTDDRFVNRRAEAWFKVAELVREQGADYPEDQQTRRELSAVCYEVRSNGKLILEPKDKIRDRLGYSPDAADCWIMGQWANLVHGGQSELTVRPMLTPIQDPEAW